MKNLIKFYLAIFLPMLALAIATNNHYLSSAQSVGLLFIYVCIYHPAVSGIRLIQLNKIKPSEFLMNFIPMWNQKYFYFLFFSKN